jgi:excisionase family DNA binding protein
MTPEASPWLTLGEAGPYVHKGKRFLVREVKAGRLKAARVGGRGEYLTRRDWLDQWVESMASPIPVLVRRRS